MPICLYTQKYHNTAQSIRSFLSDEAQRTKRERNVRAVGTESSNDSILKTSFSIYIQNETGFSGSASDF